MYFIQEHNKRQPVRATVRVYLRLLETKGTKHNLYLSFNDPVELNEWVDHTLFTVSGVSISYSDASVHMTTEAYCELAAAKGQESVLGWTAWL